MTPQINTVLSGIRRRLMEAEKSDAVAWGPNSMTNATQHGKGKPGDGGATNEPDAPDALDKYLQSIADRLVADLDMTDDQALGKITATARRLSGEGVLPALPGQNASATDIAEWIGKAATIGFAQHVFQDAQD